jgi:hypothetical protein
MPAARECRGIFSPCAAAVLHKRQALLDVGGFDEDYFCYLKVIAKAKWNALCGLPGMLKKRRAIQSAVRIPRKQIHDVMTKGWLKPYQRKSRYLRGISS